MKGRTTNERFGGDSRRTGSFIPKDDCSLTNCIEMCSTREYPRDQQTNTFGDYSRYSSYYFWNSPPIQGVTGEEDKFTS